MSAVAPHTLHTNRLLLRSWTPKDAAALAPLLLENYGHLGPWIPARVAEPAPADALEKRLAAFAAEFEANREWRYALLSADGRRLLGEVDLFPRDAAGRVPYENSDRAEVGYWLRAEETGNGYINEAVQCVLDVAVTLTRFKIVEIRCDSMNRASAAVPERLGFVCEQTIPRENAGTLQVWTRAL